MRKTEYNVAVVKEYCKPAGKQQQLAKAIGVSPAAISRLRNNKHGYIDDKTYDLLDNFFNFNEIVKNQYERDLIKAYRKLPEPTRSMVLACIQTGIPQCANPMINGASPRRMEKVG